MSANIYWRPTKTGVCLSALSPSTILRILTERYGGCDSFTIENEPETITYLRGTGSALGEKDRKPIDELIAAVEEHDTIHVWAEY